MTPLRDKMFVVELESGQNVTAKLSDAMQAHFLGIMPGDPVTVELSEYDQSSGEIVDHVHGHSCPERPQPGSSP